MISLAIQCATPALDGPASYGRMVRALLEAVAYANALHLEAVPTPPLYQSGVRYGQATSADGIAFADVALIRSRGVGICSGLSAWRVAELRAAGERGAAFQILWRGDAFHVRVRRSNGTTEDPSERLGMTRWDY